jgi:hypothetical protein
MSMAHRQFGSISAVFSAGDEMGQLRADQVVLHTVATREDMALHGAHGRGGVGRRRAAAPGAGQLGGGHRRGAGHCPRGLGASRAPGQGGHQRRAALQPPHGRGDQRPRRRLVPAADAN